MISTFAPRLLVKNMNTNFLVITATDGSEVIVNRDHIISVRESENKSGFFVIINLPNDEQIFGDYTLGIFIREFIRY